MRHAGGSIPVLLGLLAVSTAALRISPSYSALGGGGTLELWPGTPVAERAAPSCLFGERRVAAVRGPAGDVLWCTVPAAPDSQPGAVVVRAEVAGAGLLAGSATLSYYDPNELPQLSSVAPSVAPADGPRVLRVRGSNFAPPL